jgi:glycosyltransferase involved in cell wall biosynthesis
MATVSVVIPYYKAERTIARAVQSVLAQTVAPLEILIIDDGSHDSLSERVKEYSPVITVITKSNGGAASARNVGIERARGEWIAFLDADDYWEPSKLERQLAVSEGVGLVGSRWFTESPDGTRSLATVPDPGIFGRRLCVHGANAFRAAMNFCTDVVLVSRKALGDQRFVTGLETAEDRDLWIRLISSTTIYLLPEPLATYLQYMDSLSNSDPNRDCTNMISVVRRHSPLLGTKEVRKQEALVYRRWAGCHLARGNARSAIIPAARRLVRQPHSIQAWWIVAKSLVRSIG